jgi:RNA polymerase sigma-70 factor (sigma-E family)
VNVVEEPGDLAPMGRPEVRYSGDRGPAVVDLFVVHHHRLIGLASLLVDDRSCAEEVVQDAFLALHRRWARLRDPNAAVAYLNACVVNGSRRKLRQGHRFALIAARIAESTEELVSAEGHVVTQEEMGRVRREIRELPRRQREVLVLRYYLDQSEAQIAATLGISRGSVKSHASRGLSALAARLEVVN